MKTRISLLVLGVLVAMSGFSQAKAANLKEWTFLVFLNANNNLDSYSTLNLKEMEKVGSTKDVNIVVQWASLASKTTKRMLVKKSTNPNAVTSPVITDMGPVDMGDWHNLVSFVDWAAKNYPAKKYFLSIWDHGSGWHGLRVENGRLTRDDFHVNDISYDETTGNSITTLQLGDSLREISKILGQKIDLYGSDACLMAMAELGGEMRDTVNVMAGSEETEPVEGWPYDVFLAQLAQKPTMDARELADKLSVDYVKSYMGGSHGTKEVTFSAVDLRNYDGFAQAMHNFSNEMTASAAVNRDAVMKLASGVQSFEVYDYKDLLHFLGLLDQNRSPAVAPATIAKLRDATQGMLISSHATANYANAKGVAFWLPTDKYTYDQYKGAYSSLRFDRDTDWGTSLNALLP